MWIIHKIVALSCMIIKNHSIYMMNEWAKAFTRIIYIFEMHSSSGRKVHDLPLFF